MINSTYICVCIIYECVRYTWVYYVMGLVFWIHVLEEESLPVCASMFSAPASVWRVEF